MTEANSSNGNDDEKMRKYLKPAPTQEQALTILRKYYAGDGRDVNIVKKLDSYDDCNFEVMIGSDTYLLKITNGLESRDFINGLESPSSSIIEFQHTIMNTLHENGIVTTVPVKHLKSEPMEAKSNRKRLLDTVSSTRGSSESNHNSGYSEYVVVESLPVVSAKHSPTLLAIRLYTWVCGDPMSTIPYHRLSLNTLARVGQKLGRINQILDKIPTPVRATSSTSEHAVQPSPLPQHRYHQWDTKNTFDLSSFTSYISDPRRRSMIESILQTFHTEILTPGREDDEDAPTTCATAAATQFRRGVIMGDYNDANIILDKDTLEFSGVIDFGDSLESWRVLDITIAMAYAMLTTYGKHQHASLSAMAAMLRGYHSVYPLTNLEREHLVLLIVCRLACSVTLGAYSIQQNPENAAYLSLHSKPAWEALELLWGYDNEDRQKMKHVLNHLFDRACRPPEKNNNIPPTYDLAFPDPLVPDPFVSMRRNQWFMRS